MKNILAGLALAFAFVGAAGCGGSQKAKAAARPSCADAGAHARALFMATPDAAADVADKVQATLGERCAADAWSADAIACMATASEQDMGACSDKLTAEQKESFANAMMALGGEPPPSE